MDFYTDGGIGGLPTFEAFLLYLLIVFLIYLGITAFANTEKRAERERLQRHRHSLREGSQPEGRRKRSDILDSKLESDILKDLFKTDVNAAQPGSSSSAPAPAKPVTVNELIVKAVDKFETGKKAEKKTAEKTAEKKSAEKTEKKTVEKVAEKAEKKAEKNLGAGSDYDWMEFLKTSDSKTSDLSPDCLLLKAEAELERGRPLKPSRKGRKTRSRSSSSGFRKISK